MADEQKAVLDFEALKKALVELDKLPIFNHHKQKLEAHETPEGLVELRTKSGAVMLVMCRADYDACLEWEQNHGN